MEEINIKELLEFFIQKLRFIILITLVVVLAGAVYSMFFIKPEYEFIFIFMILTIIGTIHFIFIPNTRKMRGKVPFYVLI